MTSIPKFEPINAAHAIVESIVFFELASPSAEQLLPAVAALPDRLGDEFDKVSTMQQLEFKIGPNQPEVSPAVPAGVELLRHKGDGSREWVIRVSLDAIALHCLDYTRWKDVWARSLAYLTRIVDSVSVAIPIRSIGLKVVDRFVFSGQETDYNAELLFRRDAPLLHPRAFTSGSRWHCHTGWFDPAPDGHGEVLDQLNVTSARGKVRGENRILVSIEHNLVMRLESPRELGDYLSDRDPVTSPSARLMSCLHESNRDVLLSLLTPEMAALIKLQGKKPE